MITESIVMVQQPVTGPGVLELDGVLSCLLHNAGTATATIDGALTVAPNSTLQLAVPLPNVVISSRHRITFGAGSANLQVVTQRIKGGQFSNYETQGA